MHVEVEEIHWGRESVAYVFRSRQRTGMGRWSSLNLSTETSRNSPCHWSVRVSEVDIDVAQPANWTHLM